MWTRLQPGQSLFEQFCLSILQVACHRYAKTMVQITLLFAQSGNFIFGRTFFTDVKHFHRTYIYDVRILAEIPSKDGILMA